MFVGDREVGDRMHSLLLIGLPSHHHNSQCGWFRAQFCTQYTGNNAWDGATHYTDAVMGAMASQITSLNSTVYSGADQRKHQSFASLTLVWGIHRGPVNSPHKWPVTRKMFPFDDVIMEQFIRSPEGYSDVYIPSCEVTREIKSKITLKLAH